MKKNKFKTRNHLYRKPTGKNPGEAVAFFMLNYLPDYLMEYWNKDKVYLLWELYYFKSSNKRERRRAETVKRYLLHLLNKGETLPEMLFKELDSIEAENFDYSIIFKS